MTKPALSSEPSPALSPAPPPNHSPARQGAAPDFERVMREHNRMMFRLARSILRDDAEAEDAVQDAYLSAFRNLDAFRGEAALSTWLARIVINEAYARLRKRRRDATVIDFESRQPDAALTMIDDPRDDSAERPDKAAMRSELRALLERRIDALPEQFRIAFILREVQEMSVDDAAEILGVPAETVRSRAFRARAMLRESLARDLDEASVDAFGFDGARCDRLCAAVLSKLGIPKPSNPTNEGEAA